MNLRRESKWWIATALAVIGTGFCVINTRAAPNTPVDTQQGVEVLTRGPVHEAFAETVTFNPEPGIIVPKAPRDIIEEVPPDERPEGVNVTWIPGYWAWDDERNDFLWVSGIWRDLPPGRQWVPGYWGQASQGYQWTSGYWADAAASETEYLPEPPESVEVGPNIAAPAPDQNWSPGCWVWHESRYAWRPGYWSVGRPDWDWVPAHYIWAPRGYVFSDGYWDYSVERRGVLFAPVYFETGVYTRRDFRYAPSFAINLEVFTDSLFLRPSYQHYYFGDYYAAGYRGSGFDACFSLQSSRSCYDPIFAHARWEHREDREWGHHVETEFNRRRDHEDARPPRTLALQISLGAGRANSGEKHLVVAASFDQMAKRKDGPVRFQPVEKTEKQQFAQRGQEVQKSRVERQKLEARPAGTSAGKPSKQSEPARVKLAQSPIVAKPVGQLSKGQAPPKRPEAPKADPKVEPRSKLAGVKSEPSKQTAKSEPPKQVPAKQVSAKPAPQPKREAPKQGPQPKPAPKPESPKPAPQPKPAPKPESPKPAPQPEPAPNPESPKPAPQPKPAPKPESPKPAPQTKPAPKPKSPKPAPQPKPEPQQKPESPKPATKPKPDTQRPTPQPRPTPLPMPAPLPSPEPPKPAPKPDPSTKVQSKEKPSAKPKGKPKNDSNEKP